MNLLGANAGALRLLTAAAALAIASTGVRASAAPCPGPSAEYNGPSGQPLSVDEGGGRDRLLYEESHALLVGESRYKAGSGWRALPHVPIELDALSAALRAQGFHVVRYDDLASSDLSSAMECFVKRYGYRRDARIVVYFAGHGFTRVDNQPTGSRSVGYLVPIDAPKAPDAPGSAEEIALIDSALRLTQFQEWAGAMEARHVLLIFDSCFSGTVLGHKGTDPQALKPRPPNYVLSEGAQSPIRWFLTSGMANQTVPAESYFNNLIVQALTGLRPEADVNRDGFLTSGELVQYIKGTVPDYNPDQTPDDGKIRDPLLDVGDMAFRLPDRLAARNLAQAAAASRGIVLAGQALDSAAVLRIAGASAAPAPEPVLLQRAEQTQLAEAVQELESSDTRTRRAARATLAKLVAANGAGFVGELVRGLPHGSYRYQLGVGEALAKSPAKWRAADQTEALAIVNARSHGARDQSLRTALNGALRNAER